MLHRSSQMVASSLLRAIRNKSLYTIPVCRQQVLSVLQMTLGLPSSLREVMSTPKYQELPLATATLALPVAQDPLYLKLLLDPVCTLNPNRYTHCTFLSCSRLRIPTQQRHVKHRMYARVLGRQVQPIRLRPHPRGDRKRTHKPLTKFPPLR